MSLEFVTPWDLLWSHLSGFPSEHSPIPPPLMAQVWNVQLAPGARQNLPVALSVQQGAGVTI